MLHPALTRAVATAQVEDLHRAAAAAKLGLAEVPIVRSASTRLRGRRAPQADGMTPTEISGRRLHGRPQASLDFANLEPGGGSGRART